MLWEVYRPVMCCCCFRSIAGNPHFTLPVMAKPVSHPSLFTVACSVCKYVDALAPPVHLFNGQSSNQPHPRALSEDDWLKIGNAHIKRDVFGEVSMARSALHRHLQLVRHMYNQTGCPTW